MFTEWGGGRKRARSAAVGSSVLERGRKLGIEIAPYACRIVQIDGSGGADAATIVRSVVRASAPDAATLAPYRGQRAAVVAWGLQGDHRQAVVTRGSYQRMRRDAVNAARQAGVDTRQMVADIARTSTAERGAVRGPVVLALARMSAVAAALRPLTAAGLQVRSLVTPALALMSLARLRHRLTPPAAVEGYVALEEVTTAIALLRDGVLVAAREMDWGYQDERQHARSRDDVVERLGAALEAFLDEHGVRRADVAQVCVCGGMPELRSMTLSLTERLDVEIEPLDSLFGIDADRLPEPADDLRERAADMRLAWAVAADWDAPINLLRERQRRLAKTVLTRAAVVAGVATGVGVAWWIQRSDLFAPAKRSTAATVPGPRAVTPLQHRPAPTPTLPSQTARLRPQTLSAPSTPAQQPPPPRIPPAAPPVVVLTPIPEPARPVPLRESQKSPELEAAATRSPVARRPPPEAAPLPFEAALGTILYGADRKLAIVDGRIVQVGDQVRGARVVEITADAVLFRDREGRLRRLALEDSRR